MRRKIEATLWNDLHPNDPPRRGLIILDAPSKAGDGNQYISCACGGEDADKLDKTARRIAALWNAAEDIGSTTKEIEDGVIQFAFELGERHAEVINAAKERIEKLKAEKAECAQVLQKVLSGYYEWYGDREEIDPIMVNAQRYLDALEAGDGNEQ